jgi:hypothetical protein
MKIKKTSVETITDETIPDESIPRGGYSYSFSDEERLKDVIFDIISDEYSRGASAMDIKSENIRMELDKYSGHYIVAERRKNIALDALVESGRLTLIAGTKSRAKFYMFFFSKI